DRVLSLNRKHSASIRSTITCRSSSRYCLAVLKTFGLPRIAYRTSFAGKLAGMPQGNFLSRRHRDDLGSVWARRTRHDIERLVADRHSASAIEDVVVVVAHLIPWSFIDHGLVALQARPFFAFERANVHRSELDSVDHLPGLSLSR